MSSADELERRASTKQVAAWLGLTPRAVEKLCRAGELDWWDARLPGSTRRRYAVSVSSVREWLRRRHWRSIKEAENGAAGRDSGRLSGGPST